MHLMMQKLLYYSICTNCFIKKIPNQCFIPTRYSWYKQVQIQILFLTSIGILSAWMCESFVACIVYCLIAISKSIHSANASLMWSFCLMGDHLEITWWKLITNLHPWYLERISHFWQRQFSSVFSKRNSVKLIFEKLGNSEDLHLSTNIVTRWNTDLFWISCCWRRVFLLFLTILLFRALEIFQ